MADTINQVTFDLSLKDPDTDAAIKANVYTVEGVTGADGKTLRLLSIGQLVMAICLQRASELETEIIAMMKEMEATSERLEELSAVESRVIEVLQDSKNEYCYLTDTEFAALLDEGIVTQTTVGKTTYSQRYIAHSIPISVEDATKKPKSKFENEVMLYDDFITKIEAKMDEKNSFSQQTMIELQSKTNKRDQSYDMVSNILKSLNTTMTGNVNNY
jgi:hypothetical protein